LLSRCYELQSTEISTLSMSRRRHFLVQLYSNNTKKIISYVSLLPLTAYIRVIKLTVGNVQKTRAKTLLADVPVGSLMNSEESDCRSSFAARKRSDYAIGRIPATLALDFRGFPQSLQATDGVLCYTATGC
jgi:hypothetical protein